MISARTAWELVQHFARRGRWFFVPLLVVLVVAGFLLLTTSGAAIVSPFVYALF